MLNNFIYAKTKDLFLKELEAGNVLDEAIVFIEDTKEIWNHGTYFDCSTLNIEEILENYIDSETLQTTLQNYVDKSSAQTITGQKTFNSIININGKTSIRPNIDSGELKVTHNNSDKGFIIRTKNCEDTVLPLEILSTNGYSSYQYNFPKTSGTVALGIKKGNQIINANLSDGLIELNEGSINITYQELKTLRDNSQLITGQNYRITDYRTTAIVNEVADHKFDIIVTALDTNILSENAKVVISEGELGSKISELFSWEMNPGNWLSISDIPELQFENSTIYYQQGTRTISQAGVIKVIFTPVQEDPETNDICIGADLVKDGVVISKDYHVGRINYEPRQEENNEYILTVSEPGSYVIRYFVMGSNSAFETNLRITAELYDGVKYFSNSDVSSWEIKYCLDNDTTRFNWAGSEDGKGVIYYMKDDHDNECPYDFKNILFNGYYTFSYIVDGIIYDGSVKYNSCYGNKILGTFNQDGTQKLNKIIFKNTASDALCCYNSFGWNNENNTFGSSCASNTFGNYCINNSFGDSCQYNIFGDYCQSNKFNNFCQSNNFGTQCQSNSFGSYILRTTFGRQCLNNKIASNSSGSILADACRMITFGDQCNGVILYNAGSSYPSNWIQNIKVSNLMSGAVAVQKLNSSSVINIIKDLNGNIIQYFEGQSKTYIIDAGILNDEITSVEQTLSQDQLNSIKVADTIYIKYKTCEDCESELLLLDRMSKKDDHISGSVCIDENYTAVYGVKILGTQLTVYKTLIPTHSQVIRSIGELYIDELQDNMTIDLSEFISEDIYFGDLFTVTLYASNHICILQNQGSEYGNNILLGKCGNLTIKITYDDPSNAVLNIIEELSTDNIIKVTYSELKSLRDNSQLLPGVFYRITDYVTTTSQGNTASAGHQFDIIVQALNENTLSENAKACLSNNDEYFSGYNAKLEAWELKYCLDNDTERFDWVSNMPRLTNVEIIYAEIIDESNFDEVYEPAIESYMLSTYDYKEDDQGNTRLVIYKTDLEGEHRSVDLKDSFYYEGIADIDGVSYDKWRKIEGGDDDQAFTFDSDGKYYIYTNIIVENNAIKNEYILNTNGTGVIYYMKDEFNNECPYDFKNIMFYYDHDDIYYYTFSFINDGYSVEDLTLRQDLTDDVGLCHGTHCNIIKPYYLESEILIQSLNNNIFILLNDYQTEYYGCYNNVFNTNCYNNIIYCSSFHSNTFGDYCYSNTFDNNCHSNNFGDYCFFNTFGNNCYYNTFGNYCGSNTLSNECSKNIFGFNCTNNLFGENCTNNTFGIDCSGNTFGIDCTNNIFNNECRNIVIVVAYGEYNIEHKYALDKIKNIKIGNGCQNLCLYTDSAANQILQNVDIQNNIQGVASDNPTIIDLASHLDKNYILKIAYNSKGELKQYCEADLIG